MNTEPSPRPWSVEPMYNGVADARGEKVAANIRPSDAALIVDAVNERDDLVENLKTANENRERENAEWVKFATALRDERDRLRDIVRRMADLSESLLANYEYRYREDANSMAFVENTRRFLRETRAAIGEEAR